MTPNPVAELFGKLNRYARACIESDRSKPPGVVSRQVSALVIVALVVLQATAPVAVVAASTPGQGNGPPSGMVGVPNAAVSDKIPDHAKGKVPNASAFRGSVMTDAHADTLAVEVTTRAAAQGRANACKGNSAGSPPFCDSPTLALNLSDAENHEGRRVAVPKDVLADALGYVPTTATVVHESGRESEVAVRERGSLYVFDVPHFSTNTVTFSGTVEIVGDPATDGSSYSYEVGSLDAVSNFSIDVTGIVSGTWKNKSGAGVGTGTTVPTDLTGNLEPTGPAAGNPEIELTADRLETSRFVTDDNSNWFINDGPKPGGEVDVGPATGTINQITFGCGVSGSGTEPTVDIYVTEGEGVDGDLQEGTLVKSGYQFPSTCGNWTIPFDNSYEANGGRLVVSFVVQSGDQYVRLKTTENRDDTYVSYGGSGRNWTGAIWAQGTPTNVQVTADDGTSASFGDMADGETTAQSLGLSTDASTVTIDADGGAFDYDLSVQDNRQTDSPRVEVNGHWTNYTTRLNDGETVSLTTNEDWIRNGTNRVNVSLAGGDAGLDYRHDARDDETVAYQGETWSERYNVSKTWGSRTENASLKIPFAGNVVSNRDVRVFINGSETGPTYSVFDGTTLEVGLGDLDPGTKTRVVANGSKLVVANGSIQVLGPTTEGNDLDTRFQITSHEPGFRIDVSGTASGDRVHYLTNASWTPTEAYTAVENGGSDQFLYVPNASAGGTATARTLPLAVDPQNDVHVTVVDPTEPRFKLRPGGVSGDAVDLTYYDTNSGTTYQLLDLDDDKVAAEDTAESPVYFSLDSDEEALFNIGVADSGENVGDGGGSGGGGRGDDRTSVTDVADEPLASPILMVVVAAAVILAGAWVASRTGLSFKVVGGVGVLVAAATLETIRPGTVSVPLSGFMATAQDVGPILWLFVGGTGIILVFGLYRKFLKPARYVLPIRGSK